MEHDPLHPCLKRRSDGRRLLDQLVHNAYKIALKGESMRKVIPTPGTNEQQTQG